MKKYYLAYGSNMNIEQMAMRCPTAKAVGTATLNGWQLQFNGVATIKPQNGAQTKVVVWTIEDADERSLDRYEGFPTLYYKRFLTVEFNGKHIKAMVYIMADGHAQQEPNGYYYRTIESGYKSAGLNTRPLIEAYQRAHFAEDGRRRTLLEK